MAAAGFEWTAPPPEPNDQLVPRGLLGAVTPEAIVTFRGSHGYGITDQVTALEQSNVVMEHEHEVDERLRSMSAAERAAYELALYGSPDSQANVGCIAQAATQGPQVDLQALAAELSERMDVVMSGPAYLQLQDEVYDCLRAEGHDYESPVDVASDLQHRLNIVTGATEVANPDGTTSFSLGASDTNGRSIVTYRTADLDDLRDLEHEIGKAEAACWDERSAQLSAIAAPVESEFLDAHAADLLALSEIASSQS